MHLKLRQLSVLFAVALMAGLVPASVLAAQPLLTGEVLSYSNSRSGPGTPDNDIGALAMTVECPNWDDTGNFRFLEAWGNAYGTYPGLFSVHDSSGDMTGAVVGSLALNFEIHSPLGANIATGVVTFDPGVAGDGTCYRIDRDGDLPNTTEHIEVWQASGRATYSALVTVGGTSTAEVGYVAWDVACINIDYETACDSSETIGIQFLGASLPRSASGDGSAQTAAAATTADPIATAVVSPSSGPVYMLESSQQPAATNAYVFLGRQVRVYVYNEDYDDLVATAEEPIRLTFMVDVTLLDGLNSQTITVLRDELPAPDCLSPASAGLTDPEAFCVLSRAVGGDGDLTLVILSLHASTWSVVAPNAPPTTPVASKIQAMNGDQKVAQGSTLYAGFDFNMPGKHPSTDVSFSGTTVTFPATCASGTPNSFTIVVNIPNQTYTDPANSSAWYPSGDQNAASTYQGSTVVPVGMCDPGALVRLQKGGTFATNISSSPSGSKVSVRWHYKDGTGGGWSGTYSVTQ